MTAPRTSEAVALAVVKHFTTALESTAIGLISSSRVAQILAGHSPA